MTNELVEAAPTPVGVAVVESDGVEVVSHDYLNMAASVPAVATVDSRVPTSDEIASVIEISPEAPVQIGEMPSQMTETQMQELLAKIQAQQKLMQRRPARTTGKLLTGLFSRAGINATT